MKATFIHASRFRLPWRQWRWWSRPRGGGPASAASHPSHPGLREEEGTEVASEMKRAFAVAIRQGVYINDVMRDANERVSHHPQVSAGALQANSVRCVSVA